jgi:hypothetical protein
MHEVNEAAEVITAAVSPDANIIFGATIKPDMQDKLEITVIATGFDAAYFAKRGVAVAADDDTDEEDEEPQLSSSLGEVEGEVETINMDEDAGDAQGGSLADAENDEDDTPFHKGEDVPSSNIWASDDDEQKSDAEHDVPAFLRRFRRKKRTESEEKDED